MKYNINTIIRDYVNDIIQKYKSSEIHSDDDIVHNVMKRLVFNEFIDQNINVLQKLFLDRRFARSIQAYLLLSSSDALGKGKGFYSFQDHIPRFLRSNTLDEYIDKEYSKNSISEILRKCYSDYEKTQSVKQRFFNFWNNRSENIKKKIVLCYYPYVYDEWDTKYSKVIDLFYENYRNPFTHSSMHNFPPVQDGKYPSPENIGQLIAVGYVNITGTQNEIDLPLFPEEAKQIFEEAKEYYFLDDTGVHHERKINSTDELMYWNIRLCSYQNEFEKTKYVHNGIFKLLTMAIIEGCNESSESA